LIGPHRSGTYTIHDPPKRKETGKKKKREFIEPGSRIKLTLIGKDEVLNTILHPFGLWYSWVELVPGAEGEEET
jgi:hypothetical protein